VVQLVRTSSIMRVVMSSSLDYSEHFLIFLITYMTLVISDYRGMAKWFGPTIIRRFTLVQQLSSVKKDPILCN